MKIMLLADQEDQGLWDYFTEDKLKGIDLIISCGDLSPSYLEFLVTMAKCPVYFVHGNHDDIYDRKPPLGCVCLEDRIITYKSIRIAGLGGSLKYGRRKYMYTEQQMLKRVNKLLFWMRFTNGIDLLVTHAPLAGYGDAEDYAHHGFACFSKILEVWKPKYLAYGHVHGNYGEQFHRLLEHPCGTKLVNAYQKYVIEIPESNENHSLKYRIYEWLKKE